MLDLEHRYIGPGIASAKPRRGRRYSRYDVVGGEDISALRVDDDTRSCGLDFSLELSRQVKEFAKEGIAIKWVVFLHAPPDGDVHDGRRDLPHQRSKRRDAPAIQIGDLAGGGRPP